MLRSLDFALAAFFVGAAFVLASFFLGILNYDVCWVNTSGDWVGSHVTSCLADHDLTKQVGFGLALNWSASLVFLFPMFVYCVCETANQGLLAIDNMLARGMIVGPQWGDARHKDIRAILRRQGRRVLTVVGVVVIFAAMFTPIEFLDVVARFYPHPEDTLSFSLKDPNLEADWSIAAPICAAQNRTDGPCAAPRQSYWITAGFAWFVHGYLVFAGAILAVGFMAAFGLYVRFFFSSEFRAAGYEIVPDPRSTDPRRGFEVLEGLFIHGVAGCFILFTMGYLVTLQNVYLRTTYGSITELIAPFLADPKELSVDGILKAIQSAISQNLTLVNANSMAVTAIGLLFFVLMVATSAAALGLAAQRGKDRILLALRGPAAERVRLLKHFGGIAPQEVDAAMQSIAFWPLKWPTLNVVMAWLVLALLCLLFVTVGFYLVLLGLVFVVAQAVIRRKPA